MQLEPPKTQCYPKYAFTALATTAPEYVGCYGPAEAEHHVAFSWRDICRRSHMGAQLNPTSIALVAALDYSSATKMDVAENRAHTAVLPSVAYHGGGIPATRLTPGSTAHQARLGWGGSCSPTRCISPKGSPQHIPASPFPLRRWRGPSWRGPAAAVPGEGKKNLTARHWGGGVQLTAEVQ